MGAEQAATFAAALVETDDAARVGEWIVATAELDATRARARALVGARHREQPLDPGLELATLAGALGLDTGRLRAVIESLDDLVLDREFVRDVGHEVPDARSPQAAALLAALDAEPFSPPDVTTIGTDPAIVRVHSYATAPSSTSTASPSRARRSTARVSS